MEALGGGTSIGMLLWNSSTQVLGGGFITGDGGVGIGKSMLMDLFYNQLDIKGKKRIHFHEFMKRLHQLIKIYVCILVD